MSRALRTEHSQICVCVRAQFVFDVSNPFQFADSLFELASLMHNPQIAATPMLVVLSKMYDPRRRRASKVRTHCREGPRLNFCFFSSSCVYPFVFSDAVGALSRAELQSSLRLDDVLSSARGGAQTPSMPPPVVLECSAVEGTGIEELLDEMAALATASHK